MSKFRVGQHKMRNGLSATIHETRPDGKLLGILTYSDGWRIPAIWDHNGLLLERVWFVKEDEMDLYSLAPQTHKLWVNVYKSDTGYFAEAFTERALADSGSRGTRVACVKLELVEGEGIEHILPR